MVAIPQFDARTVQPAGTADVLPPGWYDVVIVASELKSTQKNDGQYLQFDRKVINAEDRAHVGKVFAERLNIVNKSEQATQIAQRSLSSICHVTSCFVVNDTTQLHNIPHRVRLEVSFGDKGQPIGNEVKQYSDMAGNEPGRSGGGSSPVSPQGGSHSAQAQPAATAPAPAPAAAAQPPAQPAAAPAAAPAAWGAPAPAALAAPAPAAWGAPPAATNGAAPPAAWGRPA